MLYSWNVIGHEKELKALETDLIGDNIHHAYLFVGPEKIGKFRVLKALAGILQCAKNFCRTCPTCIQIEKKCHPDTIELEDDGESIKIQTIREIINRLNMTGQSAYKVLLIENIGRLTDEAANCILKILEEPPGKTIFLFTAHQLKDITPTIASRMRMLHFKKLPDAVLLSALKKQYPQADQETLDQVLFLSLGRSGKALQLLSEPEKFQELRDLYRQIQFLKEKASKATRLLAVPALSQDFEKTKLFLSLLIYYFRQRIFLEKSFQGKLSVIEILEKIHRMIDLLSRNVNPRLVLENIMLSL